jgi:glycosyltransferase involved in cell wall biosynthesis
MKTVVEIITGGTPGLKKDAKILHDVLTGFYKVKIHIARVRNLQLFHQRFMIGMGKYIFPKRRILIFDESLPTAWLKLSNSIILLPHQEWMREEVVANLQKCTAIWCKTRYAEEIFQKRNYNTRYIGFTTEDVYLPEIKKDYSRFIHVAGRSHLKGTGPILQLWKKHPEWPVLLLVSRNEQWQRLYPLKNIHFITRFLPDHELKQFMNSCGIHLCPSEAEGFGHNIAEALSSKALTITVNAPPMNEHVTIETGLLAGIKKSEPLGFGERFYVDEIDLERTITKSIEMDEIDKIAKGEAARENYELKRKHFQTNILQALKELECSIFIGTKIGQ